MADRSAPANRPAPGVKGTKGAPFPQKTKNWPGAPGPKGPRLNKVGFKEVKAYAAQDLGDDKGMMKDAVGKKIGILMDEHMPQKQSVAMALNMKREGRLTPAGGYIRAKKK